MDEALGRVARAPAHKALTRVSMDGLGADVARLALRVLGARLRCDRYGLCTLLIRMILLGATTRPYLPT